MIASRFMTSIFCDDVRSEVGNKYSFMGVYAARMHVANFPIVLPKFCVAMSVHFRGKQSLPGSLTFTLFRDDDILAKIPIDVAEAVPSEVDSETNEEHAIILNGIMQLFPLQIAQPCKLKARAIIDSEELRGGALIVEQLPAGSSPER